MDQQQEGPDGPPRGMVFHLTGKTEEQKKLELRIEKRKREEEGIPSHTRLEGRYGHRHLRTALSPRTRSGGRNCNEKRPPVIFQRRPHQKEQKVMRKKDEDGIGRGGMADERENAARDSRITIGPSSAVGQDILGANAGDAASASLLITYAGPRRKMLTAVMGGKAKRPRISRAG